jgi:hypothetical protein
MTYGAKGIDRRLTKACRATYSTGKTAIGGGAGELRNTRPGDAIEP